MSKKTIIKNVSVLPNNDLEITIETTQIVSDSAIKMRILADLAEQMKNQPQNTAGLTPPNLSDVHMSGSNAPLKQQRENDDYPVRQPRKTPKMPEPEED